MGCCCWFVFVTAVSFGCTGESVGRQALQRVGNAAKVSWQLDRQTLGAMASPYDLPQSPMRSREAALGALHHQHHNTHDPPPGADQRRSNDDNDDDDDDDDDDDARTDGQHSLGVGCQPIQSLWAVSGCVKAASWSRSQADSHHHHHHQSTTTRSATAPQTRTFAFLFDCSSALSTLSVSKVSSKSLAVSLSTRIPWVCVSLIESFPCCTAWVI